MASPWGAARADDRPEEQIECHPPVVSMLDGDWRREAQRFQQGSVRALARYFDGEEGGRRQFRAAVALAASTRIHPVEVVQITRELLIRGLRGGDLEQVRAAALDVRAALGSDLCGRFVRVLGEVAGRGALSLEDARELREITPPLFLHEALGKRTGAKAEQAEARLREGVPAALAMPAVLEALRRQIGGERPGDVARAALLGCVRTLSRSCKPREAEAHCQSAPREYLEYLRDLR